MNNKLSILIISLLFLTFSPFAFSDELQGVWKADKITYEMISVEEEELKINKDAILALDIREDGSGTLLLNNVLYPVSLRQIRENEYALTDKDDRLILVRDDKDRLICIINKNLTAFLEKTEESSLSGFDIEKVEIILEKEELAEKNKPETETVAPTSIYDLHVSFSEEDTCKMSNYMLFGRYYFKDDEMIGMAYDKSGTLPNLVRSRITLEGKTPKQEAFTVLDRHVNANFLTDYKGAIYYIRIDRDKDRANIAKLDLDDNQVSIIGPEMHEMAYLQFHGERLWFTGDDHRLYSCASDGNDCLLELDRKIYDPYFLNEEWLLFQDEADGETLHLMCLTDGTDIRITDSRSFNPIVDGHVLFFTSIPDDGGKAYLSWIDLSSPIREGDDCFMIKRSSLPMSKSFAVYNHILYGENLTQISTADWKKMTNDAWKTVRNRYFYLGDQYIIYGEIYSEHGTVLLLYIENPSFGEKTLFRHVY